MSSCVSSRPFTGPQHILPECLILKEMKYIQDVTIVFLISGDYLNIYIYIYIYN